MAYENNNVRAGANGAGVYIGNTEIMGGGVNNILDTNYMAPCKAVVINASDKVFDGFFSTDNGMVPILLQPNEVMYKAFDANIDVLLNLSDNSKPIEGSLSYGYNNDGILIVDNYRFSEETEIQFSTDNDTKAVHICIINQITG